MKSVLAPRWIFPAIVALTAVPAAAEPASPRIDRQADGTTRMTHELLVDAPTADVWTAISTAEGWATWAVPVARLSSADPDVLETSYDSNDPPGGPGTIQQRFLERMPGKLLVFRTIKAPDGFPHWEAYRQVVSRFELEPAGRRTRVRLISAGYPDNEAGRALVGFFSKGNAETLASLQKRFTEGPVDWTAR